MCVRSRHTLVQTVEMHKFLCIWLVVCIFQNVLSQVSPGTGLGNNLMNNGLAAPNNFVNALATNNFARGVAGNGLASNTPYGSNIASNLAYNNGLVNSVNNANTVAAAAASVAASAAAANAANDAINANNGLGLNSLSLGGMPISGVSPIGFGDVAIGGSLPVDGSTAVSGNVPVIGFVTFEGTVPAGGTVTLASNCGCNNQGSGIGQ